MIEENTDLLVIGGGISGAGVALDAASRGLKVILVEKDDFASGTSSASSKLIHGGFRYLKNRDFKLVFEALHERGLLLNLAPGIVEPLPFLVPVYNKQLKHIGRLFKWVVDPEGYTIMELLKAPLALRLSVLAYDLLAGKRKIKPHKILSKQEILKIEPGLNPNGLSGGAVYWDAFGLDFKLTLNVLKKARENGARCLNYAYVKEFIKEGNKIVGATIVDRIDGSESKIFSKKIVITAGPWADIIRAKMGIQSKMLKPSKGSHIVLSREKIQIRNAIVMEAIDGRLTFAIPWDDLVIVGTTEIEHQSSPDNAVVSLEEVNYLIEVVNRYFPNANIMYKDIIATYSGVRPLVDEKTSVSEVSREHRIIEEPEGVITLTGGKLTTYRVMAKDVVDILTSERCATESIKLKEQISQVPLELEDDIKKHLLKIYDKEEIVKIGELIRENPKLKDRISPRHPYIWAEVNLAVELEFARRLSDVIVRRLGFYFRGCDIQIATRIAEHMAGLLGWDTQRMREEIEDYKSFVEKNMEWKP